ncbi:Translation initiation factor 4F, ribosome/mRNA-bridging subunit (eIF-4G) [Pseudoloma neurophilia]|uniref:Translation initiation factor 4F, ribosome/mRNA-bridging subunit (EIF-4G) n=1 Tax=Pseudoloma neurophilia TaxID=146866 RepID=A0A0R0M0G9_9MICR|nr:Translation initiation factor 4F, ribosome/mRNA-bridging subunit (eIF-4G) [Pseudoloma neurophilia]
MPNYIIKRIVYYPKKAMVEIGPPSSNRHRMSHHSSQDSDIVSNEKNKAKELILPSGSKITREMLDQMNFSSTSSEESSSEESVEDLKTTQVPIKNIDMVIAQETKKIETEEKMDTESEESNSSDEEDGMGLEDALMKQFNIDNSEIAVGIKDELQIENVEILEDNQTNEQIVEKKKVEIEIKQEVVVNEGKINLEKMLEVQEKVIEATLSPETTVKQQTEELKIEKPVVAEATPEGKAYVQKENQAEIKEEQVIKIPIGSAKKAPKEPEIYQFTPQSIDSLPAKLFIERIREEFHCAFVARQGDALVLNDLFKKSYAKRLLNIIDDELQQPDITSNFANSLQDLKDHVNQKNTTRNDYNVSYTIDKILSIKERSEVSITVDKKIFSSHFRREKREDVVSLFRFELNRIAWTNANGVIDKIKKLKVIKDSEMLQLSKILFEKAIAEDAFCKLYAHVLYNLHKTFKSDEEKKRHEAQTVFFNEIIKMIQDVFNKKEKWASQLDLSSYTIEERLSLQDTIDDENIIKEAKKGRMLGTVKFVSYLYANSVIGFKGISFCLNSLMDFNDEEKVETLSLLLINCGEKIVESDKSAELTKIVNELKKPWEWSLRIKFLTQDVIKKCEDWLKSKKKKSPFKNAFSALQQNMVKTGESKDEPILSANKENTQEITQHSPDTDALNQEDDIFDIIDKISRVVEDIPHVIDYTPLVDELTKKMNDLGIDLVYKAFFLMILEHYDNFTDDMKFLHFFLAAHTSKPTDITAILDDIDVRVPDIVVDSPFAQKNFNLLVFSLNKWLKTTYSFDGFDPESAQKKYDELKLDE